MHASIGSQLENARKISGISLKDAAESTKIRTDFLSHFENNNFDIGLPEVYSQGFLKLYANYLKLDGDEIIREYRIQRGLRSKFQKKERTFGNIAYTEEAEEPNIEEDDELPNGLNQPNNYGTYKFNQDAEDAYTPAQEREAVLSSNPFFEKSNLIKLGSIFGGALLVILLLTYGVSKLFNSSKNSNEVRPIVTASNIAPTAHNAVEEIYLIATGNVHVIVRQENDKKRLFAGNLADGDRVAIKKTGRIKILFSEGQNLILEKGNHQYGMNAQGNAVRVFE